MLLEALVEAGPFGTPSFVVNETTKPIRAAPMACMTAILAKAFRGELVPQDPDDEPASVLLERIRADREAAAGIKQTGKRGRRSKATQ